MVDAFVMIKTEAGQSEDIVTGVRKIDEVAEAHIVAGEFDIMTEVTAEEVYQVLRTASSSIQDLDGITETRTYIALD
ncbi:MAG: Lrp/AsnC family transcriptional regulator [Halobacteriales archaeon]